MSLSPWDKVKGLLKRGAFERKQTVKVSIPPYKPPPISNKKPRPRPGYWEANGSPLLLPRAEDATAVNDILPLEVLLDILTLVILQAESPHDCLLHLSLVCKHWQSAVGHLEFVRVKLQGGAEYVDKMLERIHITPEEKLDERCKIRVLEFKADPYKDFHRLPEVLACAKTTVQELFLNRAGFNNTNHFPILSGLEPHPVDEPEIFITTRDPDVVFPRLRILDLDGLLAYGVVHLIASCDRTQLRSLTMANVQFPLSPEIPPILQDRTFPNLRSVIFSGRLPKDSPLPAHFLTASPNLEQLGLTVGRADLYATSELLRGYAPETFWHPKIVVKLELREGLETDDWCLVGMSSLIRERGWKRDIRAVSSSGSWSV